MVESEKFNPQINPHFCQKFKVFLSYKFRGEFAVQRRSMKKEYCPGYLDLVTGGVVNADDTDVKAVRLSKIKVSYKRAPRGNWSCSQRHRALRKEVLWGFESEGLQLCIPCKL
jgi:hypothetical protein